MPCNEGCYKLEGALVHVTYLREGVTSAAAARGINMLLVAAAVRPAVSCRATGLCSFWALQNNHDTAHTCKLVS